MVAEVIANPETTEETADPVDPFPEHFRKEIRKAQAGITAAASDLDATATIAHARALRSALYRAEHFKTSSW